MPLLAPFWSVVKNPACCMFGAHLANCTKNAPPHWNATRTHQICTCVAFLMHLLSHMTYKKHTISVPKSQGVFGSHYRHFFFFWHNAENPIFGGRNVSALLVSSSAGFMPAKHAHKSQWDCATTAWQMRLWGLRHTISKNVPWDRKTGIQEAEELPPVCL